MVGAIEREADAGARRLAERGSAEGRGRDEAEERPAAPPPDDAGDDEYWLDMPATD